MEYARGPQRGDDGNDRRGRQIAWPNRVSNARGLQIHRPAHPRSKICVRRWFVDVAAPFRHGAAASPLCRSRKRRRLREADARSITMGTAKLKKKDANEKIQPFLRHYGPALLGLLMLVLVVHDIFGTHGFLAMRRTQQEIKKVNADLDQLNKENLQLEQEVRELKTDPHKIEKIARDELGLARPGEVIIKIRRSQQLPQDSTAKP